MTNLDFSPLINILNKSINGETVLSVMGAVVSATIGIFLTVWGAKKIISGIQITLKYGRLAALDEDLEGKRQKYYSKYGKLPDW